MLAVDCEMVSQSISVWFNKITGNDDIDRGVTLAQLVKLLSCG